MIYRVRGGPVHGELRAPPSKSYTHRAVIIASLAGGSSTVRSPLIARDTVASINAARLLGAEIEEASGYLRIRGRGRPATPEDVIDAMNSGTTLRIMTPVAGLVESGYTVITGDASLRRRPMQPLLDALHMLGVRCWSTRMNGCAPIIVEGGGRMGGACSIRGDVSSQFISGLLIAAPCAERTVEIRVKGELVSRPYVDATLYAQSIFGVEIARDGEGYIAEPTGYSPAEFTVPGDYGLAAFLLSAPFVAGGEVEISGLTPAPPQADKRIIEIIGEMGGEIEQVGESVRARHSELRGIEVSLRDAPDLLPPVACLACVARGTTSIRHVGHARYKESDRVRVLSEELRKLGVEVEEHPDGLSITPRRLRPARLESRGDHRLFMCFSILAMAVEGGLEILDPGSFDVSYPGFVRDLSLIGGEVEVSG